MRTFDEILRIVGKVAGIIHFLSRLLRGKPATPPQLDSKPDKPKIEKTDE